jgi:hypothetical protein
MPEQIFMKLGMYIIAPEPISTAYFINVSHRSVCLYVYAARQRFRKNFTLATNTQAKIEKLLDVPFSMRSVPYQKESVGLSVHPSIVARQRLAKHVPAATGNCWRRRFLYGPCSVKGK